jgi:hypothetical protein
MKRRSGGQNLTKGDPAARRCKHRQLLCHAREVGARWREILPSHGMKKEYADDGAGEKKDMKPELLIGGSAGKAECRTRHVACGAQ